MISIYAITHDRKILYIGQTVNFAKRTNRHFTMARCYDANHHHANYRSLLARYMSKVPEDEIEIRLLGTCVNQTDADSMEKRYIEILKPEYNIASGGKSGYMANSRLNNYLECSSIKGKKIVIHGRIYKSIASAARFYKKTDMCIRYRCFSDSPRYKNYRLVPA